MLDTNKGNIYACGKEIDKDKIKNIEEIGAEPFCDSYYYSLYNFGEPFFNMQPEKTNFSLIEFGAIVI